MHALEGTIRAHRCTSAWQSNQQPVLSLGEQNGHPESGLPYDREDWHSKPFITQLSGSLVGVILFSVKQFHERTGTLVLYYQTDASFLI